MNHPVSELMVIDTQNQTVAERILIPGVLEMRHIAEAPGRKAAICWFLSCAPKT